MLDKAQRRSRFELNIDIPLLLGIVMLMSLSMLVLYSSGGGDVNLLIKQLVRDVVAMVLMIAVAQVSSDTLRRISPQLFVVGLILLTAVLAMGIIGKGAQRWLDFGVFRFQPSEIMKLAVPMMVAWVATHKPLPLKIGFVTLCFIVIAIPAALIAVQPDLGTAILVAIAGLVVIFLAGISWRLITILVAMLMVAAPVMWSFVLHDYQKRRIITLFDPWSDPLGAGYHTIQSMIAIGSGGAQGKGWLGGTQSQLEFIPERSTDFIFSVFGEEFGLWGAIGLLAIYLFVVFRGIMIAFYAQESYDRLLAGSITLTFLFYVFVNIGMVSGILPVVGVPLPLISYGGTSIVTLMLGFGILMSVRGQKRKLNRS